MNPKAIVFDLDDTLYHNWPACDHAACQAVGAYASCVLGLDADTFTQTFAQARGQINRELFATGPAHDRTLYAQRALEMAGIPPFLHAEPMFEAYWAAVLETLIPEPDAPDLLHALRAAGLRVGLCTNMTAEIQFRKIRFLGLENEIDFAVTSEEAGIDKPAPAIFQLVLKKAGAAPQEVIFVGDTFAHDIAGALDAGMSAVWMNRYGAARPAETRAYLEVKNFPEAAAYLRTFC